MREVVRVCLARILGFLRPRSGERDFDLELEAHLAMAEEDAVRRGIPPEEARRLARVELGGLTQLRESARAARGIPRLDALGLDLRLGVRMLYKTWVVTLVGCAATTIVIAIGATVFALLDTVAGSTLPLEEGERIVAIQPFDAVALRDLNTSLGDFRRWRDTLQSVDEIGAFRVTSERAVDSPAGGSWTVPVAEMTASAFQLARVRPLMGRPLLEEDELPNADPVILISSEVWRTRFASDPNVVGQRMRLDGRSYAIVGVMPEGFGFPVNHDFWTTLALNVDDGDPAGTEDVFVIGRLAPGATLESAAAEVAAVGLLPGSVSADGSPLGTRVVPYASTFNDDLRDNRWTVRLLLVVVCLLLLPPSANIALLLYARNLTRQPEFAARYALGASRGRIVAQLFIEALVLTTGAAGLALLAARQILSLAQTFAEQQMAGTIPFWMRFDLSPRTVLFAIGLALLAATVAGLLPGLQATGRMGQAGLQGLGSRTAPRLGRRWTAAVVMQVALTVAVLPAAGPVAWDLIRPAILDPGFPIGEFGTVRVTAESSDSREELVRQLEAEPGVAGVASATAVPGIEPRRLVEVSGDTAAYFDPGINHVDPRFFGVFDARLLAGRLLNASDFQPSREVVVVNRTFAERSGGMADIVGRRVRYPGAGPDQDSGPGYEVVGIIDDLLRNRATPRMYHPLDRERLEPVDLILRGDPASLPRLGGRLIEIGPGLAPALTIGRLRSLQEVYAGMQMGETLTALAIGLVVTVVALFSLISVHTLLSFAVAQHYREIGIRCAMGAQPSRIVTYLFRRALVPVCMGAVVGALVSLLFSHYLLESTTSLTTFTVSIAIVVVSGALALIGPARRALLIHPGEALREG